MRLSDIPKRPQQGSDGNFAFAVDFDVDRTVGSSLELQPGAAAGDDLCAVQVVRTVRVGRKENTGRTDQLGHDDALGAVDHERTAAGHPGVITEVDFLLFDFAGDFVGQLDDSLQRRLVGDVVFARFGFRHLRIVEVILLET